ncbi:MAG: response regulator [Dehalococcoidales bacterium]|nr:response regulator [Dehalococcoidales bacterium]
MDVLIIEDDLEDRCSIEGIFSEHLPDFNVITDSGCNCLDILKKNNPHLVVLSLNISGMDCMRVIEKMRNISDVPIIVLSERGCPEMINALEAGASSCMRKPVNHREFVARVGVLFRGGNHD